MSDENPKTRGDSSSASALEIAARTRAWRVPVILLSVRGGSSYGCGLLGWATTFGPGATNPGTLYKTLRRMEKEGLLGSAWETSEVGPARRAYSITEAGEAHLRVWAEAMERYQRNVDASFDLYEGGPSRTDEEDG